jgi:aspartyl-tRNA(Asn)/glutamyl-tRNA(Gln) amidotransferase subunit A
MDLVTTSRLIRNKELSPVELVNNALHQISVKNSEVNAFITVCEDEALEAAKTLEQEMLDGNLRGPLHGIPIAAKDLIFTKNIRTTMGSKLYESFVPDKDAAVIERLKGAGAIIIGKTNTHEFAYGPIGDRSYFGPCRNPHQLEKISGGSSSGSAAAVAAGMVGGAIGTDTGGSIRIPSSACGAVGMKPTFGLVSKRGVFDLAYTLDHVGPITANISDNALLLNTIAGYDEGDPYSLKSNVVDYSRLIGQNIQGKVIGIPSYYFENIDEEVSAAIANCLNVFERLGAVLKKVDIRCMKRIASLQVVTIQAEAAAVHTNTIQHHRGEVDEEVYERLVQSQNVKGYEYVLAQVERKGLITEFNQVFSEVDILVTPTLPILPTDIGQRDVVVNGQVEAVRHALLRLTSPTDFTGNPSISLPCGFSKSGLPIGVQLIAMHGNEDKLYQFGYALEQSL